MMKNRPEFLEVQGGAGRIGAAGVSISWRSTASELVYLANHCGAKVIVFEADLWPTVEQAKKSIPGVADRDYVAVGGEAPGCDRYEEDFLVPPTVSPRIEKGDEEEAAVVIYTSGTTGKPKGAVRKFPKDATFAILSFIAETPMRVDDVHLVTCPLYHSTAFGFLAMSGMLGATCVLMDEFKPEGFLQHVERYGVTSTALVPTMLHRVLALGPDVLSRYDTRSLRLIFSGGAPLSGPLAIETMDHFGDILFNFYGATETGLVTLAKPEDLRAAPGCIGKPVPGNEIRLLDDAGRQVPVGQVGELYARNKMLVAGYHHDAESTRASMREGFFSVGDLARRDRDGRYFIEGRKRDMVISGGVNVYPAEVIMSRLASMASRSQRLHIEGRKRDAVTSAGYTFTPPEMIMSRSRARRVAARRVPDAEEPLLMLAQVYDHLGRRERVPGRGRVGPRGAPRARRGGGRGRAGPRVG